MKKIKLPSRDDISATGKQAGRKAAKWAWSQAVFAFVVAGLVGLGFFFGCGIGAWVAAAHFALSGWLTAFCVLAGFAGGAVLGVLAAQAVVVGAASGLLWDAGIDAGLAGWRHARRKKSRDKKQPD